MNQNNLKVQNLLKVSLSVEAGTLPDVMDLANAPRNLAFIFGIGSGGITPFEYELVDREAGDVVTVRVEPGTAPYFFEHLACSILRDLGSKDLFYIKATILSITKPDQREIIKAMAEKAGCGDGCECGCGCDC